MEDMQEQDGQDEGQELGVVDEPVLGRRRSNVALYAFIISGIVMVGCAIYMKYFAG